MSVSLVLGNGLSRLSIPADLIKKHNSYACNFAYRDFSSNNVIMCDRHVLISAVSEKVNLRSKVWTRCRWINSLSPMENVHAFPKLPFVLENKFDQPMNWGSGTYAGYLACLDEPNIIVFAGFDLWDNDGKVNNVYAGQNGYGPKDAGPVNPSVWIYQFAKLFKHFTNKQFVFVNYPKWKVPEEWSKFDNFFFDELKSLKDL
jgi:hypothetical protein